MLTDGKGGRPSGLRIEPGVTPTILSVDQRRRPHTKISRTRLSLLSDAQSLVNMAEPGEQSQEQIPGDASSIGPQQELTPLPGGGGEGNIDDTSKLAGGQEYEHGEEPGKVNAQACGPFSRIRHVEQTLPLLPLTGGGNGEEHAQVYDLKLPNSVSSLLLKLGASPHEVGRENALIATAQTLNEALGRGETSEITPDDFRRMVMAFEPVGRLNINGTEFSSRVKSIKREFGLDFMYTLTVRNPTESSDDLNISNYVLDPDPGLEERVMLRLGDPSRQLFGDTLVSGEQLRSLFTQLSDALAQD